MSPKAKVRIRADGPFQGMQGRIEEYLGAKQRKPWLDPVAMYRVALVNGMTLTFAASELEEI